MHTAIPTSGNCSLSLEENTDDLFFRNASSWGCPHDANENITNIGAFIYWELAIIKQYFVRNDVNPPPTKHSLMNEIVHIKI